MAHVKNIRRLTLMDMWRHAEVYGGIAEGLLELPVPDKIKINKKLLTVPKDRKEFADKINYGQRLYLSHKEDNDYDLIIRIIGGFYYSDITGKQWDEDKILTLTKNIVTCKVKEIYPVTLHLIILINETIENEQKLLYKEPTKMELAAGIEKLNIYAELNVLDFLSTAMKCTVKEVLAKPYNECLVRLMNAKEITDYQERYMKLQMEESELKYKKQYTRII